MCVCTRLCRMCDGALRRPSFDVERRKVQTSLAWVVWTLAVAYTVVRARFFLPELLVEPHRRVKSRGAFAGFATQVSYYPTSNLLD